MITRTSSTSIHTSRPIMFLSGYFNPLTNGHLDYISTSYEKYSNKFDLFIIVNSDSQSVAKHKYSFLPQKLRLDIIDSLRWVDFSEISISKDETVAADLEKWGQNGDIFINSGDRPESTWNPKEVEVCKRKGIEMVYLQLPKVNSSSKILDDYFQWRLNQLFTEIKTKLEVSQACQNQNKWENGVLKELLNKPGITSSDPNKIFPSTVEYQRKCQNPNI